MCCHLGFNTILKLYLLHMNLRKGGVTDLVPAILVPAIAQAPPTAGVALHLVLPLTNAFII